MAEAVDDFVRGLQEKIFEKVKEVYGEKGFHRWLHPVYMGEIKDPDGYARLAGVCGDTMEIFLNFENERVKEASFRTDGCGLTTVCGSFAAEMSVGRSPDELLEVTGEAILKELGKLPEESEHCAFLAAETLQEALNDYMIKTASVASPE